MLKVEYTTYITLKIHCTILKKNRKEEIKKKTHFFQNLIVD